MNEVVERKRSVHRVREVLSLSLLSQSLGSTPHKKRTGWKEKREEEEIGRKKKREREGREGTGSTLLIVCVVSFRQRHSLFSSSILSLLLFTAVPPFASHHDISDPSIHLIAPDSTTTTIIIASTTTKTRPSLIPVPMSHAATLTHTYTPSSLRGNSQPASHVPQGLLSSLILFPLPIFLILIPDLFSSRSRTITLSLQHTPNPIHCHFNSPQSRLPALLSFHDS